MAEPLYQIETDDGDVLERGLTMAEAEIALCRHINLGAEDASIGEDDQDWIYCANRMPEIDYTKPHYNRYVDCLVTSKLGEVFEARYLSNGSAKTEKGRKPKWDRMGRIVDFVVAWKPMPEPAKDYNK